MLINDAYSFRRTLYLIVATISLALFFVYIIYLINKKIYFGYVNDFVLLASVFVFIVLLINSYSGFKNGFDKKRKITNQPSRFHKIIHLTIVIIFFPLGLLFLWSEFQYIIDTWSMVVILYTLPAMILSYLTYSPAQFFGSPL
jgi:polyferredoxin